ncbi:putative T7SS-secreted protein [Actinokineospora inagensis]|uniref:putative T7SS-secreted protein n=1 Tax=Actinokineospora inagensis TaxID=103730 RepID=UPI0006854F21|nr:hypothetical protein [Actinokineospora inagensis]
MTELGQTNDPAVLIPGNPDSLTLSVDLLMSYGDMLGEAGAGLARIDTADGWSGPAADGFRQAFEGQPGKWTEAGDCFHSAATAVDHYVATLIWAQGQAAEAIREWDQGQAATNQARADHDRAVRQAQSQAAATGSVLSDVPFVDPGEARRQTAREMLGHARQQLAEAGNTAADIVDRVREKAPPKPSWLSELGSDIEDVAGDVWHGIKDVSAHVVNGVASFGNAIVHHPGEVFTAAAGMGLTAISAVGEGGGLLLDATGVGAVVGIPVNAVSAAGMATGIGITTASMAALAIQAGGDDHVEPVQPDNGGGSGGGEPSFEAPKEITGRTEHGEQQIQSRDGHGVNDEAVVDAVANPTKPPRYIPDKYGGTYRYVGQNATVNLNKAGQVVTAWARNSAGWRSP